MTHNQIGIIMLIVVAIGFAGALAVVSGSPLGWIGIGFTAIGAGVYIAYERRMGHI